MAEPRKIKALVKEGRVAMTDDTGESVWVPESELGNALSAGYSPVTSKGHEHARKLREAAETPLLAAGAGALRGATLGLSDVAMTGMGLATPESLRYLEEANPSASMLGEGVGTIASAALPGGIIGRAGQVAAKGVAKTGAKKAVQAITRAATEGAAIGAGQGTSEAVLHEMKGGQAASHIVKSAAKGGAAGAGFGVAGLALGTASRFVGGKLKGLDPLRKPMAARHVGRAESAVKKYEGSAAKQLEKGNRAEFEMATARAETEAAFANTAKSRGKDFVRADYTVAAKAELEAAKREAGKLTELLESQSLSKKFAMGAERRLSTLEGSGQRAGKIAKLEQGVLESELGFVGSLLAKATEEGAESAGKKLLASQIGGIVGGMPGMFVGSMLQPVASKLVRRAVMAGAPLVRGAIQGAGKAAVVGGKSASAASTVSLTATEYTSLAKQLRDNPPEVLAVKIQAMAPQGATQQATEKAINDASEMTGFLSEKLPMAPPEEMQRAPSGSRDWAPDRKSLSRYSRYVRAAMNPSTVPEDFAIGKLTPEAMETIDRLHPEMAQEMKQIVSEEVARAARTGTRYDRRKAQQIALVLGDEGVRPRMYDQRVVAGLQQNFAMEQAEKAARGGSPSLDKQHMSKLQSLLTRQG